MTLLPLFSSRPFPIEGLPLRGSQLFHHPYLFRVLPSLSLHSSPNLFSTRPRTSVIESRIIQRERKTYAMPRRRSIITRNLESIVNNIDIRRGSVNSLRQICPVSFSISPSLRPLSSPQPRNIYIYVGSGHLPD